MPSGQPEVIKNPEVVVTSVYSNNATVEMTPWDFRITFAEIIRVEPSEPSGKIFVDDRAKITMSPQHAKALVQILQNNIAQYEKNMGVIPSGPAIGQPVLGAPDSNEGG